MKRTIVLAFLFAIVTGSAIAQTDDAAKYAAVITTEDLQKNLTIIAGEEMQGRETGTEGQRKAAAYIESQFKAIGLKTAPGLNGSYQQFYPLFIDSLISSNLTVAKKQLEYGTDYYVPLATNETRKISAKKIVFVGYGISEPVYDDYNGKNVKGKIVVFFTGEPKSNGLYIVSGTSSASNYTYPGIQNKLAIAKQKGAAGAIVISPSSEVLSRFTVDNNRQSALYYPRNNNAASVGYVIISHATAKSLLGKWPIDSLLKKARGSQSLAAEKTVEISKAFLLDYKKKKEQINASNVIGIIEGTDKKDEYVYLTAHYDHMGASNGKIFYGADDDGSGTCGVIQMAKAFAKAKAEGHGPRRTIIFMTVSAEEKGLWGSEYYTDNPLFPLDKTSVDLNTDMVGRIDTERKTGDTMNYVYVIGHDKISSDLPVINEGVNNKYTQLQLDYKFDDPNDPQRIYYRSDHYNFARKGVPVLFFYDGMLLGDYHKPTDTVEKITWSLYEKRVRMIFHTAWEIANRDAMLQRDKPLPTGTR